MRKLIYATAVLLLPIKFTIAQIAVNDGLAPQDKSWFIAAHGGYDIPSIKNHLDYISYKGNLTGGVSISHFWKWYGFGADADYTITDVKNLYPTGNNVYVDTNVQMSSFTLTETKIDRLFLGIGPNFKLDIFNGAMAFEFTFRAGISTFKGGKVELRETTTANNQLLQYHAGYDHNNLLATKARFGINYFPGRRNFGVAVGGYYLKLFNATESIDPGTGKSAILQPITADQVTDTYTKNGPLIYRNEPCNCDAWSFGGFISLKVRLQRTASESVNQF